MRANESLNVYLASHPEVLRHLLDHLREGFILLDEEGRILTFNKRAGEWLGLSWERDAGRLWEEVIQKHPQLYLAYRQAQSGHKSPIEATVVLNASHTYEMEVAHIPGPPQRTLIVLHDVTLLREAAMRVRQADHYVKKQIQEIEQAWKRLSEEIYRDPLTGTYNRRFLEEHMWEALNRARRSGVPLGVLMVDVDNLKAWNDQLGHLTGDTLLILVAHVLKELAHPHVVARYGGDEFVVLIPNPDMHQVENLVRQVNERLQASWPKSEGLTACTVSAGLALYPWHGQTPEDLLATADAALYESKRYGKARLTVATKPIQAPNPSSETRRNNLPNISNGHSRAS